MTGRQENKLSMYKTVQLVCNENNGIWAGLPAFVTSFGEFETHIDGIDSTAQFQKSVTTGITTDKTDDEDDMVALALEVAGATYSYAVDVNNTTLRDKMEVSETRLKRERDTETIRRCQDIHDGALGVVGSLGNYGVNNAKLVELQELIDAANLSQPAPRDATGSKKVATANLVDLFSDNDVVVTKMDKLMEQYKQSEPDFYNRYKTARIIVDAGTRTTFVSGVVLDNNTTDPISQALVELILKPGTVDEETRSVETDGAGTYRFESIPAGTHNMRVTRAGYISQAIEGVVVERGRDNVVDFSLQPV